MTGSARLHKLTVSIVDKVYSMNNPVLISQKRQCPFKFLETVILCLIVSSKIVSCNYDQAFRVDNNLLDIWKGRLGHVYQFCLFFLYYIILYINIYLKFCIIWQIIKRYHDSPFSSYNSCTTLIVWAGIKYHFSPRESITMEKVHLSDKQNGELKIHCWF